MLEDYGHALKYLYRADFTIDAADDHTKKELKYNIEVNIGEAYYQMKVVDLASLYFNKASTHASFSRDSTALGTAILGQANVLMLRGETQNALHRYWFAYHFLSKGADADILCELNLGMAKAYEGLNRNDFAIYFALSSYSMAKRSKFLSRQLDAALFLSGIYGKTHNYDSAFYYLQNSVLLKEFVKGLEQIKAATIFSSNERLRQEEIAEQKMREKELRFQQLQLSVIAISIPILFLITLLISRIKVKTKVITFMTIISLLFLFEFLTLLLHPLVAEFTHHIPVFELLIFVALAALLIPAHHKLEHFLLKKLTKRKTELDHIQIKTRKMVFNRKTK